MDIKRIVVGTIVGYIAIQALYYLVFDTLFGDFYVANAVSPNVLKTPYLQSVNAINLVAGALLITLGLEARGNPSVASAAVTGAVIGLLVWIQADAYYYAATNTFQFVIVIVDPLLSAIVTGIAGAVIAAVLARIPKGAGLQAAE